MVTNTPEICATVVLSDFSNTLRKLQFFTPFPKAKFNFEHLKKNKMNLIAKVFPILQSAKNVLMQMSKEGQFSTP